MSNPYTKEQALELAEELCRVSNERFGYQLVLGMLMRHHGYDADKTKEIKECARERNIERVLELLEGLQ